MTSTSFNSLYFKKGEGRRRAWKRMHDAALVIPEDAPYCIGPARQMESFGLFFQVFFPNYQPRVHKTA
jgi:hypothetical protein